MITERVRDSVEDYWMRLDKIIQERNEEAKGQWNLLRNDNLHIPEIQGKELDLRGFAVLLGKLNYDWDNCRQLMVNSMYGDGSISLADAIIETERTFFDITGQSSNRPAEISNFIQGNGIAA